MYQFRTTSRGGPPKSACGWLLTVLFASGLLPVYAQNEDVSSEPAHVTASDVRGSVVSGLGGQRLGKRFPDASLWLELAEGDRELALLWPEREAPARGGLIILADEGGNAESGLTGSLARELGHRNFSVLTLGLASPSLTLEKILERPVEAPEPAPSDRNSNAISPATIDVMSSGTEDELETAYRERIREQLIAGVAALEERNQELVAVVGIGRGSNHLVLNAAELGGSPAMIWISPKFYPKDASKLAMALDKASVPHILEFTSSDEYEQRRAGLRPVGVEAFSLQLMGAGDLLSPQNAKALAGRISSWFKRKKQ